ncbi:glycoprotein hormone beta-5-like [Xyrauchen texanus]|uniref:glycoprotein hormone beta-5-like n=1 Tax=Xyrauchen texanus TaxID=154827 RepID=UPI0022423C5B|nr:glycoprotein hormone beta-5-like [Xyrauchen texanus]XP_052007351.1 glycoprotein hormone beta-5-like [Xyrauchen texanus]
MAHLRSGAQRFSPVKLCCFTLAVWLCFGAHIEASVLNLKRFIGCAVREFTFLARKPGCSGLHITTDACWGRCETWEKPVLDPPFIESYQRVCTYNETQFVTVQLPNCSEHVDPYYTYPVALRCDCGVCLTSTTECITSV